MNREEAPGKSPEDMYIQQKVRVLLMLKKMGSNVSSIYTLFETPVFRYGCKKISKNVIDNLHFTL